MLEGGDSTMLESRHFGFIRYPWLIPVLIQVSDIHLAGQIPLGIAKLFPKGKRNILSCSADGRGPGPADISLPAHPLRVGIYSQFNVFVSVCNSLWLQGDLHVGISRK